MPVIHEKAHSQGAKLTPWGRMDHTELATFSSSFNRLFNSGSKKFRLFREFEGRGVEVSRVFRASATDVLEEHGVGVVATDHRS